MQATKSTTYSDNCKGEKAKKEMRMLLLSHMQTATILLTAGPEHFDTETLPTGLTPTSYITFHWQKGKIDNGSVHYSIGAKWQ